MDSSKKIVRDPIYKQFKAVIKEILLKQTRWPAGGQIATERVLSDEFKLSRVTISKALSELEAEGLIEKRPPGGTFVTEKVKSRGLVKFVFYLPDPLSQYPGYALVLSALEARLAAQGMGLIYTSTLSDDGTQTRAMVVVGPVGSAALSASTRTPMVTLDFGTFVDGVDGIEIDNAAGAAKAVEFLHERGHQRIAFLGCFRESESDEWPNSAARREGYLAAMRKLHLDINPAYQRLAWAETDSSKRVAQELLKLQPAPTALVCFSEIQTIAALEAARETSVKRSREFEAVCFSDYPREAPLPGLVGSCVVPWRKIAEAATDLVLQRLDNPKSKPTQLVFPPELIAAAHRD